MRTNKMSWFWLSWALAALAGGCADTATCDPNEILYAGQCTPVPMQGADAAASEEPDAAAGDESQNRESFDGGAGEAGDDH